MVSTIDAWRNRKCYPVELGDGLKGYVRKLNFVQIRESGKLTGEEKTLFIIGSCIVEENGVPMLQRVPEEELSVFVERCFDKFGDMDPDGFFTAMAAIGKVTVPHSQEDLVKNS